MKILTFYLVLLLLSFSNFGFAQKNQLTLSLGTESRARNTIYPTPNSSKTWNSDLTLIPSISFSRTVSKSSAIEVELKLRLNTPSNVILGPGENQGFASTTKYKLKESFLSLPIMYKLSIQRLNLSGGPCIEYSISKKQEKIDYPNGKTLGDEYFSKLWSIGILTQLSYQFKLNKKLSVEPKIYYQSIFSSKRDYFGIAISINSKF